MDPIGPGTPAWNAFDKALDAIREMRRELPVDQIEAWMNSLMEQSKEDE